MSFFSKKYTDEEDQLRDSISFEISDEFLKSVSTIERTNLGKINEKTVLMKFVAMDCPEFHYRISREQHNEIVERFRILHNL